MSRVSMTLPQFYRCEANVDGTLVHLTPMETEMVSLLLTSPPDRAVGYWTLVEGLWPNPDTQALTADQVLHVMAAKLRRKGIAITTWWGRGMYIPRHARGAPPAAVPCYRRMAA